MIGFGCFTDYSLWTTVAQKGHTQIKNVAANQKFYLQIKNVAAN